MFVKFISGMRTEDNGVIRLFVDSLLRCFISLCLSSSMERQTQQRTQYQHLNAKSPRTGGFHIVCINVHIRQINPQPIIQTIPVINYSSFEDSIIYFDGTDEKNCLIINKRLPKNKMARIKLWRTWG